MFAKLLSQRPRHLHALTVCVLAIGFADLSSAQTNIAPIRLGINDHEGSQFAYDHDIGSAPYDFPKFIPDFDAENRPYLRFRNTDKGGDSTEYRAYSGGNPTEAGDIYTVRDGDWSTSNYTAAVDAKLPSGTNWDPAKWYYMQHGGHYGRIVFDTNDILYTVVKVANDAGSKKFVIVWCKRNTTSGKYETADFKAKLLPIDLEGDAGIGSDIYLMEYWTGHNALDRPPILLYFDMATSPWGNVYAVQPYFDSNDDLQFFESSNRLNEAEDSALAPTTHSGAPSFAVSTENAGTQMAFLVWAEDNTTGNGKTEVRGREFTFDDDQSSVGDNILIMSDNGPDSDSHNTPGIVADSNGYLHVVSGGHGTAFKYRRSKNPRDFDEWRAKHDVLNDGSDEKMTYLSFVIDPDDLMHIAFRFLSETGVDNAVGSVCCADKKAEFVLRYASFVGDNGSLDLPLNVSETSLILDSPQPCMSGSNGKSWYDHKMSVDRKGQIYLSYSYRGQDTGDNGIGLYTEEATSAQTDDCGYTVDQKIPREIEGHYAYPAILMSADGGAKWQLAETPFFRPHATMASVTLQTGTATGTAGDAEFSDGDSYDVTTPSSPKTVEFDFTFEVPDQWSGASPTLPTDFRVYARLELDVTKDVTVRLYNSDTSSWDDVGTFSATANTMALFHATKTASSDYISSDQMKVRFHATDASSDFTIKLDSVTISDGDD
ncbi:MAG: BNR repeat-containing protein [Phycisphaerales bacterium]|nr:BNR repeat-containing protein [Phycisphaerales bacterium]